MKYKVSSDVKDDVIEVDEIACVPAVFHYLDDVGLPKCERALLTIEDEEHRVQEWLVTESQIRRVS